MMTSPSQEWVHFIDEKGKEWAFDVTFLLSRWGCIFGNGCKGAHAGGGKGKPEHGCCSIGAHLDEDQTNRMIEITRINNAVGQMDDSEFRSLSVAREIRKNWMARNGNSFKTRILGDVCIFANDESSPNGPGCSLHQAALKRGEPIQEWKPDVCTWAPLFQFMEQPDIRGEGEVEVITRFENRYWSTSYDVNVLDWWCMDDKDAYRPEHDCVYVAYEPELRNRLGDKLYEQLKEYLDEKVKNLVFWQDEEVFVQIGRRDHGGRDPQWDEEDQSEEVETSINIQAD